MASRTPSRSRRLAAAVGQCEPGVERSADLAVALFSLTDQCDQAWLGGRRVGGKRSDADGGDACVGGVAARVRATQRTIYALVTHCSAPSGQHLCASCRPRVRPAPCSEPASPSAMAMASSQEEKSLVGHVGP